MARARALPRPRRAPEPRGSARALRTASDEADDGPRDLRLGKAGVWGSVVRDATGMRLGCDLQLDRLAGARELAPGASQPIRSILRMSPKAKRELAREHLDSPRGSRRRPGEGCDQRALLRSRSRRGRAGGRARHRYPEAPWPQGRRGLGPTQGQLIEVDYGPTLKRLNQARKDVWYEGDGPDLGEPLGDVLDEVEHLVREAETAP